jgi:hypothetical protein
MDVVVAVVGGVVGGMVALAGSLLTGAVGRRAERAEMYRKSVADFVSKATAARYEFEQLVGNRVGQRYSVTDLGVPATLTAADLACGFAYHFLTLVVDADTAKRARDLRRHLERMESWSVGPFDQLSEEELEKRVADAWRLRDACVNHARLTLGLTKLTDDDDDDGGTSKPIGSRAAG